MTKPDEDQAKETQRPTGQLNDDLDNPTTEGSGAMPSTEQGDDADPGSE
jgi:hypothetical protein